MQNRANHTNALILLAKATLSSLTSKTPLKLLSSPFGKLVLLFYSIFNGFMYHSLLNSRTRMVWWKRIGLITLSFILVLNNHCKDKLPQKNTSKSLEILPNLAIKISFTAAALMRMFPLRIVESFMRKQQQYSEKPWQH